MPNWNSETEAREEIKALVAQYYHEYREPKESKENFKPGDRISYASRVYDEKEMMSLTDAMLDFWLTTGRRGRLNVVTKSSRLRADSLRRLLR